MNQLTSDARQQNSRLNQWHKLGQLYMNIDLPVSFEVIAPLHGVTHDF